MASNWKSKDNGQSNPKWIQNSGRLKNDDGPDQNDSKTDLRLIETQAVEAIDAKYGFERINKDFGREEVG